MLNIILVLTFVLHSQAWSPTNGYAPGEVTCPSGSLIREASSISDSESDWLSKRHEITDAALKSFLTDASLSDFDVTSFFENLTSSINIGLAFSGGGYRAMFNGAGQIAALDSRVSGADDHGLGGLLQATTYLSGLSGGNWLTGTLALNNWTSVDDILASGDRIWDLENTIFNSGGWNIFKTLGRWDDINDDIQSKENAGFEATLTDLWGRALSFQFFGEDQNGFSGLTFSSLRDFPVFQNAEMPFPITVADGRTPGTYIINENSTVFEFNPFELGSWDPSLNAFTDLKYIGTNVSNGSPVDNETCFAGFDNAGFVLGTSSSLFNQFLLQIDTTSIGGTVIADLIKVFLNELSEDYDDIALYQPNPFYASPFGEVETIAESDALYLVDGGEDLQNVPLSPLLQPERSIDIIFAFDNSADTDDYLPNGASLVKTYERQFVTQGSGVSFPYVPGEDSFIYYNLSSKPTFFGCDASNLTALSSIPPLVVYIANTPYDYWSNTSTYKMSYEDEEKTRVIQNGFEVASRYNLTIDPNWKKCVSCAIIRREQERNSIEQSEECQQCFQDYCWNGEFVGDLGISLQSGNWTSDRDVDSPDNSILTLLFDQEVSNVTSTSNSTSSSNSTTTSSSTVSSSASSSSAYSSTNSGYKIEFGFNMLIISVITIMVVCF